MPTWFSPLPDPLLSVIIREKDVAGKFRQMAEARCD
jgi:hypothetical protein